MVEKTLPEDVPADDLPSADEDVAKLRLTLRHRSLEELIEDGLVNWSQKENMVVKGDSFDKGRPLKE